MRVQASKYSRLFYLSILSSFFLMLVFTAYAHASGKEMNKEVSEAASAIGDYTIEQKDAAVSKAKEMMDTIDELRGVYELETNALMNCDTKSFMALQDNKLSSARKY